VLVLDGEKVVGAATGVRKGRHLISGLAVRPQVSVSKNADRRELVKNLTKGFFELSKNGADLLTLHCADQLSEFAEFGFNEKRAEGTYEVVHIDLTKGADAVFKGFSQSRRSDLRKAMRENKVQIAPVENESELKDLYQIHVDWSCRKQITPHTWEMMQKLFSMPQAHRILVAKHEGKIIAGSFFRFYPNALFEYVANNSIPEYQYLRPNDLLVWKGIEWACGEGFPLCTLGASHLFLRRFGGEIFSSHRYQFDRTFLKKHEKKEAVLEFTLKTYRAIPYSTRQRMKKLIGKS
jgi:hypothetical protein